ncbi:MAG: zinc metalloprotease HtpX [Patescibacteria group bacterium]
MGRAVSFIKTSILLAGLTGLIIMISYLIGGSQAIIFGIGIALVMNVASYWFSDKIVLKMAGASPLSREQAPDIYQDVSSLAKKMEIPMPKLYMSQDQQPNAFATGRDPKHGVVCVTQGLVSTLNRDEVRGVLAHELAHIKNYDILTSTIAAVLAGAISSIAEIFFWFGLGGGDGEDSGPLGLIGSIAMIILAPIAAMLIQFAISRTREYAADATAAKYTGEPQQLAQALIKIQQVASVRPMYKNAAISSLYIQNPGGMKGIKELFSTHPLTEKRVEKLMNR